jgi:nitrile hydratase beta subunit
MNGVHDMGGMHGFGRVERDDALFHAEWEKRQCALSILALRLRLVNPDEDRHSLERIDPKAYLRAGYFERWQAGLEMLLVEKGVLTRQEIAARVEWYERHAGAPVSRRAVKAPVAGAPGPPPAAGATGPPPESEPAPDPRFAPGDRVVTRNVHPIGHTRLPRYARGKRGLIERVHGVQTFPDTNAHGLGHQPQPVYGVRFEADELWGGSADGRGSVHLDLWESYLVPA